MLRCTSIGTWFWMFCRSTVMAVWPSADTDRTVTSLAVNPTECVAGFTAVRGAPIRDLPSRFRGTAGWCRT